MSVYKGGDNFGGTFRAFNNSLAMLYGLLVTGTMWSPFGANPTAMPEAPLAPPTAGNLVVNGDFDEGVLGWDARSDFYDYGGSETFTASDGFALQLFRRDPDQVIAALRTQAARFTKPRMTTLELLEELKHPQRFREFAIEACRWLAQHGW